MFGIFIDHFKKLGDDRFFRLSTTHKGPAEVINLRVCGGLAILFCLGGLVDLFFSVHPAFAIPNILAALACLMPVVWLGVFHRRDAAVWKTGIMVFWISVILAVARTGGVTSPVFGSYNILMFMAAVCVFVNARIGWIIVASLLHFLGWVLCSEWLGLTPDHKLSSHQLAGQNGLLLLGAFCVVINFVHTTALFARECEAQTKRLSETQHHLTHSEKMAEVGKLVATTAHELAQPIQVVMTASSLLRRMTEPEGGSEQVFALTQRIHDACHRATRLLNQLREFSRKDQFNLQDVDLAEAIHSVHLLSNYDLRWRDVRYEICLADEPLLVRGDSLRLQQILFNLINNARDACSQTQEPVLKISAQNYGAWVRIVIWNNGEAIPLDVQKKLFRDSFTTKDPGRGTGLGLTICEHLVQKHSGRIFFSSQSGDTAFIVDLPRLPQSAAYSAKEIAPAV